MKKIISAVFIVATIALSAPVIQLVRAQSIDLGVENVGLLPSNPFYFLKEWSRGFRRLFTANSASRAELELDIVNEKAAELEKLGEITPHNQQAIIDAAENYRLAAEALKHRLENLKETTKNPNVDRLINDLTERSLKHQQLFDSLFTQFTGVRAVQETIEGASNGLLDVLVVALSGIEDPADFGERFRGVIINDKDEFRELRASQLIDRLEEKVPDKAKGAISALKEDLLISFSGRLQGLELSASSTAPQGIERLPGSRLRILKLLDEVREITQNSDLRNNLNLIRQAILGQVSQENGIGEAEARRAIDNVKSLIVEVEQKISEREGAVRVSVKELLNRAKFNLEQAEKFYQDENYGAAYGQATAAYAGAKAAWNQLMPTLFDQSRTLDEIKQYYDSLVAKAREAGLTKEQNPKLFALLEDAEKRIVALSKLVENEARPEVIAGALRNIKLLLATIDQVTTSAQNPPTVLPAQTESPESLPAIRPQNVEDALPESVTVVISENGFAPAVVKVKAGTKVTWFNKNIRPHWPASNPHPIHTDLPGFDAKNGLSQGETYSYTFDKLGKWEYHDHLNPALTGVVEVVSE